MTPEHALLFAALRVSNLDVSCPRCGRTFWKLDGELNDATETLEVTATCRNSDAHTWSVDVSLETLEDMRSTFGLSSLCALKAVLTRRVSDLAPRRVGC